MMITQDEKEAIASEFRPKFTLGPWKVVLSDNATPHVQHIHGEDWTEVCDLSSRVCVMPAEITSSHNSLANARLIAAAPELLDFAKEWLAQQGSDNNYMTQKAKEAIAKAEGKA